MTAPLQTENVNPDERREALLSAFEGSVSGYKANTDYYESVRRPDAVGIAVPPEMRKLLAHVGYPRLYVNALADRLKLEGFRLADADEADKQLWDWWQANDLDVESVLGHVDALVHGRSYVTVAAPDPSIEDPMVDPTVPIIRVEPPTNLYANIDPRTRRVTEALRAIYDAEGSEIISSTLYLPDQTIIYDKVEGQWVATNTINHGMGLVPVVPIPNRNRLSDLYGTSEITPELRSVTDAAARTLMLMQSTAELMGVPLRLLFGIKRSEIGLPDDPDEPVSPRQAFEAYYARILGFEDEQGKAYQFDAAELRNFVEALDALDKKAAAYTGLPPQYLSFSSDNPASAEAIRSSESRLVMNAERKARIFGGAWEQVMRVAWKVMNPGGTIPPNMFRMESIWADPATPTYAAKADAATKLYNQGMGLIPKEQGRIDMGYSEAARRQMRKWDEQENPVAGALARVVNPGRPTPAEDAPPTEEATDE
ncbi:portal protein [Mycobacterium phage RhynO]|uniref:portal protein n=1 Tax=Mycobacterium phage RhynO TaxID=1458846 RepID=UPI0003F20E02|nr:portal protein [Mycobacterium phage RhynO]AHJ88671.1 portal protein [Mycobacterium phage RhynO]